MHALLHLLATLAPNRKTFGHAIRLASLCIALTATLARADTVNFTLTPTNGVGGTYFFSTPQNPNTGATAGSGFFGVSPVGTGGFFGGPDTVFFITPGSIYAGTIQLINADFSTQLFFAGPQLFTGTEASPTYLLGSFLLTDLTIPSQETNPDGSIKTYPLPDGDQVGQSYNLVVTAGPAVAVTPEPSSLVLLGTGMIGALATVKRRLQKA